MVNGSHWAAEDRGHVQVQLAALEAAANGIVITDREGVIEWVNPAFTRLTGYGWDEAVGRTTRLLKSGRQDPDYYRDLWQTVTSGMPWTGELINRRKDSTEYIEDMTITPVRDDQGAIGHFVAIKQDVTVRRQTEQKLRDTLAQLEQQYVAAESARSEARAILDSAGDAMLLIARDTRLRAVNRRFEEFFGTTPEEVLARPLAELLPRMEPVFEDAAVVAAMMLGAAEAGGEPSMMVQQRRPAKRELQLDSTPVPAPGGGLLGQLFVFRDVTHQREVDRMKSEFVSLVSHELRTPLTAISGFVDLLLEEEGEEAPREAQKDLLRVVKRNSERLTALIEDLLDVSRIEAGRVDLKIQPVDVAVAVHEVVQLLRDQFAQKEQSLVVDIDPALPRVHARRRSISRAPVWAYG
jgi:PAS domain S-box-containing protein